MPNLPEGSGAIRAYAAPPRGPNLAWFTTVPPAARWRLLFLIMGITTSALVANRYPYFQAGLGAAASLYITGTTPFTAASTWTSFAQPGYPQIAFFPWLNYEIIPLPFPVTLLAASTVEAGCYDMQVGDQIDYFNLIVEEWIEP